MTSHNGHTNGMTNGTSNGLAESQKEGQKELELLSMSDEAIMLDHNARLYFDLDQTGQNNNLFSFYAEYEDYLNEGQFIDVSTLLLKINTFPSLSIA